jgi:hypothetical protein
MVPQDISSASFVNSVLEHESLRSILPIRTLIVTGEYLSFGQLQEDVEAKSVASHMPPVEKLE